MIRTIMQADLHQVARLLKHSFDPSLWPYMTYTQHGIEKFLAVAIAFPDAKPTRVCLVYPDEQSGAILGFADLRVEADEAFVSYICVTSEARGMGIATSLVEHFLELNPTISALRLDTFQDNVAAKSLYSKLGFTVDNSTVWLSRPMPIASTPIGTVDVAVSMAAHEAYGFCKVGIRTPTGEASIGLLGATVVRCFSASLFDDDVTLAGVRSAFPSANTAFAIVPAGTENTLRSEHNVLKRSDRMTMVVQ